VAAPKAPVLDASGGSAKQVTLAESVFASEPKAHLVHEAVRAELNARRAGTRAAKSRGLVSGGRGKPWRQKGTGRARAGTIRAPQFTGGGVAFPPSPRSFEVKVNRKVWRSALRTALTDHAQRDSFAIVDPGVFDAPSTKQALAVLDGFGKERPAVLVVTADEENVIKSFRNLDRVLVLEPAEVEVAAIVWARTLLATESGLEGLQRRAGLKEEA
jgi:large subunit ribosomal protein L4